MERDFNRHSYALSNKFKRIITWIIMFLLLVFIVISPEVFVLYNNITYVNDVIPLQFDGVTIAHISNIDNNPRNIVSMVNRAKPNIVIISGGFVDSNGNYDKSVKAVNDIASKYSTYYVLQSDDQKYKDDIVNSLKATYINNKAESLNNNDFSVDRYLKNHNITKEQLDSEGSNESGDIYYQSLDDINKKLMVDSSKTVNIIGNDGCLDNTYDIKDQILKLYDSNALNILVYGNSSNFEEVIPGTFNDMAFLGNYGINSGSLVGHSCTVENTQVFNSYGVAKTTDGKFRTFNFANLQIVKLSCREDPSDDPLTRLFNHFMPNVGTRFDNDGGIKAYTYTYGDFGNQKETD